jgi:hypothetical protein
MSAKQLHQVPSEKEFLSLFFLAFYSIHIMSRDGIIPFLIVNHSRNCCFLRFCLVEGEGIMSLSAEQKRVEHCEEAQTWNSFDLFLGNWNFWNK